MSVIILCRSLGIGGAERQLIALAKGLHARKQRIAVAVFYSNGPLMAELEEAGVPTFDLKKGGRWDVLPFLVRVVRLILHWKASAIYSFLSTPNIVATFVGLLFPKLLTVLSVRASNVELDRYDWLSRASYFVERKVSGFADLIICNSVAGCRYASAQGFPRDKMIVIPNGIDTDRFKPDVAGRIGVRKEWGIADETILVGLVARLDPMKDHPTFLRAAAMAAKKRHNLRFVCVGDGPADYKAQLYQLGKDLHLDERLIWAGVRHDPVAIFNSLDVAVSSSSYGEGFPNAIAEAMACGVPCVTTDVGDSKVVVADLGVVVPPRLPDQLAEGIERMVDNLNSTLSRTVRASIVTRFTTEAMVAATLGAICRSC